MRFYKEESVLKVAAILPAFNEATRVAGVINAVLCSDLVDEVIVVNDGSTDDTAEVVDAFPEVTLVNLPVNCGKGAAMTAGVQSTEAEILLFLDSDLIGLHPGHVDALLAPVLAGEAKMAVGRFRGGRRLTDWSQKLVPSVSGQRAITRDEFEQIPYLARTRYGVEMAITRYCHHYRVPTVSVLMEGVTHPMKEEKLGYLRGTASRIRMYSEILRIMLDPRAPRRVRPRRLNILRRIAANRRLNGNPTSAVVWIYRKERTLRKRLTSNKSSKH